MLAIEYNGQRKLLPVATEQEITQALFQLVQGKKKNLYFVGGHGEKDPRSNDPREGYSEVAAALTNENFVVYPIQLGHGTGIPDDAAVVVVSGPQCRLAPRRVSRT